MASKRPGSDSGVCEPKKKRKHMTISVQQKVDLLRKLDKGVSVRTLCQQYNIGSSTVYDIKKQKNQLLKFYSECESKKNMEVRKTLKEGKSSDLDSALIQWFKLRRAGNVPVSGEMLMAQAKIFHAELNLLHDCEYSQGWLQKFKTRHGITLHRICGEKSSADKDAATKFVDEFAQFIAQEKLTPEQVYNADETALYWRRLPGKTLAQETEQECSGSKGSKDRVSVLGCSNAAGTHKTKLLVIGKSVNPRCFKNVKVLPVIYRANKKGWMTTKIFLEWFERYFVREARAHCTSAGLNPDCKIVLLLDNCSSHPDAALLVKDNVMALYLPPNCTSLIQPCDQGILRSMKCKYRSAFMHHVLLAINNGKDIQTIQKEFTLKDAIWTVAKGWGAVTPSTLKNGWHKLWPELMFADSGDGEEVDFKGFQVSQKKAVVRELMEYASSLVNPKAEEMVRNVGEDNLMEWLDVDQDAPTVHQMTDAEIVEMVKNDGNTPADINGNDSENESDEDEAKIQERVSIDKCIQMTTDLIEAFEQRNLFTEQEIMTLYLWKDRLIKEKPKLMKQTTVDNWLRRATSTCKQATADRPAASTTDATDVSADASQAHTPDDPAPQTSGTPDVSPVKAMDITPV